MMALNSLQACSLPIFNEVFERFSLSRFQEPSFSCIAQAHYFFRIRISHDRNPLGQTHYLKHSKRIFNWTCR